MYLTSLNINANFRFGELSKTRQLLGNGDNKQETASIAVVPKGQPTFLGRYAPTVQAQYNSGVVQPLVKYAIE